MNEDTKHEQSSTAGAARQGSVTSLEGLTRYNVEMYGLGDRYFSEHKTGRWVEFADVERLLAAPSPSTAPAPQTEAWPRDMAEAKQWIVGLRKRVNSLLAVINSDQAAPAPQQSELSEDRVKEIGLEYYPDGASEQDTAFARAIEREVLAKAAQAAPSAPTDLAKRLRDIAADGKLFTFSPVSQEDLRAAADEIERYYGGMMAWKQTAEKKDRDWNAERMGRINDRIASKAAPSAKAEPYAYEEDNGADMKLDYKAWFDSGLGKMAPDCIYRPLYLAAPAPAVQAEDVRNQACDDLPKFDRKTDESEYGVILTAAKFSAPRQHGREFSESGLMAFIDVMCNQKLEEAAEACENERVEHTGTDGDTAYNNATEHCAAAIRALRTPSTSQTSEGADRG